MVMGLLVCSKGEENPFNFFFGKHGERPLTIAWNQRLGDRNRITSLSSGNAAESQKLVRIPSPSLHAAEWSKDGERESFYVFDRRSCLGTPSLR